MKLLFFLIFIQIYIKFAFCIAEINIKDTGVFTTLLSQSNYLNLSIPKSYQAFIFTNKDMGKSNNFFLNDTLLRVPYRNVYGIAFNESLSIILNYSASGSQTMAIYIIPTENCGQHSYYSMSSVKFQTKLTTNQYPYPFRGCAFSPSLIVQNRTARYEMKGSNNLKTFLFYGQPLYNILTSPKSSSDSYSIDSIKETENISPSYLQSKGFLQSIETDGQETSVDNINSSFYIVFDSKEINQNYEIIFDRSFASKGNEDVDLSLLSDHSDFLLYYDSTSQSFTYDSKWAKKASFNYQENDFFEKNKWIWGIVPMIMITAALIVICSSCCCIRIHFGKCCKHSYRSYSTESSVHSEPHENEQFLYSPHIEMDDQYVYSPNNINNQFSSSDNNVGTERLIDTNNLNSDCYEYEYEYENDDPESPYYHNEDGHNNRRKTKIKKIKSAYQNNYVDYKSKSPYQNPDPNTEFYMSQYTPSDKKSPNPYEQNTNNTADINNENESVPNPYGLPNPMNNTDNSQYYF